MVSVVAVCLAGAFFILAAVHLIWLVKPGVLAASAAIPTQDGRPVLSPGPISTSIVAILLIAAGLVCLWRVGVLGWQYPAIPQAGLWLISGLFLARAIGELRYVGFFKTVRDTPFARLDTMLYSPLCVGISLAACYLATRGRPS